MERDPEAVRRRVRAALALGGYSRVEQLADVLDERDSGIGLKRLRAIWQKGDARAVELREIAAACSVPYWFLTNGLAGLEAHHIGPVSAGGDDSPDNVVVLDAAAHRLLDRMAAQLSDLDQRVTAITRTVGERLPAPGGELGRRLRERETSEQDRREPATVPDTDAQRDTGQ
jgi:hypothetical protein